MIHKHDVTLIEIILKKPLIKRFHLKVNLIIYNIKSHQLKQKRDKLLK